MLPGLKSAIAAVAASLGLTFIDSALSSTGTITVPATSQVGDLAILLDAAGDFGNSIPSEVVPSGFTLLDSDGSSNSSGGIRSVLSYRILTAGQPGSSITGKSSGAGEYGKIMLVFRPSKTIVSITAIVYTSTVSSGVPAAIAVNPSAEVNPVIVIGAGTREGGGGTPTVSYASTFDATVTQTAGADCAIGYKIINSSPPGSSNISRNDAGFTNILQALYLRVVL